MSPLDYLVALQRHAPAAAERPGEWRPWAYEQARARLEPAGAAPARPAD